MNKTNTTFEELAEQFTRELRDGDRPSISEYAANHQNFAKQIRQLFPIMEIMEAHGTPLEDLSESGLMAAELDHLKTLPPLRRLGDYRIVREIGRGGMGIVFEAHQESLDRKVALKLLPDSAQFDSRRLTRFEHEAKASAMLHHTNIVPVFGVGSHENTAYFVMQYIDGQPLDNIIREISKNRIPLNNEQSATTEANAKAAVSTIVSSLSQSEKWISDPVEQEENETDAESVRQQKTESNSAPSGSFSSSGTSTEQIYWKNVAKIGIQVADALHYAHSKQILHRDIKPSNLMIDQSGCAWVTDFGLAKYFESPNLTRTGEIVGTLRYMSPEQLNGSADQASDIFGLGLTLYELTALKPAYDAADRNQLMKQVLEASPPALRSLNRKIPRDLETIIHKCIANEPKQRYSNAGHLGEDLQRFIDGEPVQARRINPLERTAKWCRRRPAIASLMAALLLSMIAGIAGVTWQWQKTSDALELANQNLVELQSQTEIADEQRAEAVAQTKLANQQRFNAVRQTRLANQQRAKAILQTKIATQQKQIAENHFGQARESVERFFSIISQQKLLLEPGLQPLRKELLEEALNYHKQFVSQYRDDDSLKFDLGKSLYRISDIEGTISGDPRIAKTLDEPIEIFRELGESDPDNPDFQLWLARCLERKSALLQRYDALTALNFLKESIEVLENLRATSSIDGIGSDDLARQYQMIGLAYEAMDRATKRTDRSLEYYTKSFVIRNEVYEQDPTDIPHAIFLADINRDLGITYRRMGKFDKTVEHYDQAINILKPIVRDHPDQMLARRALASVSVSIGFFYGTGNTEKDYTKAIEYYQIAANNYQELSNKNPLVIEYQDGLARAASNSGGVYQTLGQLDKALEMRISAEAIRGRLSKMNPQAAFLRSGWAVTLNGLGSIYRELDRFEESTESHQQAHEEHVKSMTTDPNQPIVRLRLIDGIIQQVRTHAAAKDFQAAIDTLATVDDFCLPRFSKPFFQKGVEFTILATKIGALADSPEELTEQQRQWREKCLDSAKSNFSKSAELGFPVLRESLVHPATQPESEYSESQLIHAWLKEQFEKK